MAYDEQLAERIRALLAGEPDVVEQRMFGGLAFLVGGHIAAAASGKGGLMARVEPEQTAVLLALPDVAPFEMRGRPMDGWLRVAPAGVATREQLEPWVRRGLEHARSLPPKA